MIIDKIENAKIYSGLNKRIETALNYIKNMDFAKIEPGKLEIEGDNIFAIVSEYDTKKADDCLLEGHKKYIDLQYLIDGKEQIGFTPFNHQKATTPYNEEEDYWLFNENFSLFTLNKSSFAIFFPDDLHLPGIHLNESIKVKKLVIKIKI